MLGIPLAAHKTEGPTSVLVFLGILIDTEAFELCLPADKLARVQETIRSWVGKKACTRKELESLLGHLSHAAAVISQGRIFLRQLLPLLSVGRSPYYFVCLNAGARADLLWWNVFLQDWNGTSFFPTSVPAMEVISDASGTYSCGAFSLLHGWFQLEWPEIWLPVHITAKELLPIVIAAALWGHQWKYKCICFKSDNMAVVDILHPGTSYSCTCCVVWCSMQHSIDLILCQSMFLVYSTPRLMQFPATMSHSSSLLTHRCPSDHFHSQS